MAGWNTPWFVGGANHDSDVARVVAYAAFHGQEGVLASSDCAVRALSTPGPFVRVMPGISSIYARGLGNPRQTYANALETEDVVSVAPTGAGGGRSDLVILRVEDPNIPGAGWSPSSATDGPFQFTRIIPNVPANTNNVQQVRPGDSAITLARIDIPANTATITQSMITDLRSIADLEGERLVVINNPAPPVATSDYFNIKNVPSTKKIRNNTAEFFLDTAVSFSNFPADAFWDVPVPSWAVACDVEAVAWAVKQLNGPVWGESRVSVTLSGQPTLTTQTVVWDNDYYGQGSAQALNLVAGGDIQLPTAYRGQIARFRISSRFYDDPATTGSMYVDDGVAVRLAVTFRRYPTQ